MSIEITVGKTRQGNMLLKYVSKSEVKVINFRRILIKGKMLQSPINNVRFFWRNRKKHGNDWVRLINNLQNLEKGCEKTIFPHKTPIHIKSWMDNYDNY